MPIYEYQCDSCGVFEFSQRITEDPLKKCPTCKGKVRRLISNTSFMLKGNGWYATDYGRSKTAPASTTDSAGSTPSNGKTSESTSSSASTEKSASGGNKTASSGDKTTSST